MREKYMSNEETEKPETNLIIMRFGRNCLSDSSAYEKITEITNKYKDSKLIYVVSALPEVTDLLQECIIKAERHQDYNATFQTIQNKHNQIIHSVFPEYQGSLLDEFLEENLEKIKGKLEDIREFGVSSYKIDYIFSFGEMFSAYILSNFLSSQDFDAEYVPANNFIITGEDNLPVMDIINRKIEDNIRPLLKSDIIPVTSGSIGRNKDGYITTLGPGGADLTATILADSIQGDPYLVKVIFWEPVEGIMTADPKIEPSATLIETLSYEEAKEIAHFGAKVLHPRCIPHVQYKEIPLEIRDFNNYSEERFTNITKFGDKKQSVKGIVYIDEVAMISAISEAFVEVPGTLARLFDLMGKNNINITMVSQSSSEINTTFVVDKKDGEKAVKLIRNFEFFRKWFEVTVDIVAEIAIIGEVYQTNILSKIFSALADNKINALAISQASKGLNISILIPKNQLVKSIQVIHKSFLQ